MLTSKIRKSLAVVSGFALAMTGMVAPANAAGMADKSFVSLAPTTGTAYGTLVDLTFSLTANEAAAVSANGRNMKFLIEDANGVIVPEFGTTGITTAADLDDGDAATVDAVNDRVTITNAGLAALLTAGERVYFGTAIHLDDGANNDDYDAIPANTAVQVHAIDGDDITFTTPNDISAFAANADLANLDLGGSIAAVVIGEARAADGSIVVNTGIATPNTDEVLKISAGASTVTRSAVVTAWVDDNGDGDIDATEYTSTPRTVTFYANADLTVTTTLVGPVLGSLGATASIAISPELNGQQVGNNAAEVTSTWTLQASTVNTNTATYNTTTKVWDVAMDLDGNDTIVVGTYSIRASVNATAIGNTAQAIVRDRVAADTAAVVAASDNTTYVKNTDASDGIQTSTVRKAKSATVVMTATDADGVAVGAGKSVTVYLSNATNTTDWTINGTKVLDNAASGTKYYTTDANGQVTLEVSSTAGAAGDTIDIEFSPENVGAAGDAANAEVRLTWAAASYAIVDLHAPLNGTARNLTTSGSISFDLYAGDQWNAPLTGSYRVQMTASGRADGTTTLDFSNGRATYTVADAALGGGNTITVATQLQKLSAGVWGNSADATDLADITVTVSAAPATAVVVTTTKTNGDGDNNDGNPAALATDVLVNYDAQTYQGSWTDPTPAGSDTNHITLGAGSGLAAGDVVTVSGAGMAFLYYDDSAAAVVEVGLDSYTFVLDNAADYVRVLSNTYAKDAVVTVAARGRSGTTKVTTGVAGADSGASVNWTTPATVAGGKTFTVKGTLVDKFGNVVDATDGDVKLVYTGPGFVSGSLPTDTGADGTFQFSVLLGTADTEEITVTFQYDTNADGDLLDLGEFSNSVKINAAAAADTKVNAGSFKGYVAIYAKGHEGKRLSAKVGKDWVVVESLASNFERVVEYTGAGYTIAVRIYIDRVLVDTITVVTK